MCSVVRKAKITKALGGIIVACVLMACLFALIFFKSSTNNNEFIVPEDDGIEDPIKVIEFEVPENYSVSSLYYMSCAVNTDIQEFIKEHNLGLDPDTGIFVYSPSEDSRQYWFPSVSKGRVSGFTYCGQAANGKIACSFSLSDAEVFEALSVYTSKDTPMYITSYNGYCYYIIGENAYINSECNSGLTEIPNININEKESTMHVLNLQK